MVIISAFRWHQGTEASDVVMTVRSKAIHRHKWRHSLGTAKTYEHTDTTLQLQLWRSTETHSPHLAFIHFCSSEDFILTVKDPVLKLYPGLWWCIPVVPTHTHTGEWKILRPAWTTLCDPVSTTTTIIIAHCCYISTGCDDAHLIPALRSQRLKDPESVSGLATQGVQSHPGLQPVS